MDRARIGLYVGLTLMCLSALALVMWTLDRTESVGAYRITCEDSIQDLEKAITAALEGGWRCEGGMRVYQPTMGKYMLRFCQTMTR